MSSKEIISGNKAIAEFASMQFTDEITFLAYGNRDTLEYIIDDARMNLPLTGIKHNNERSLNKDCSNERLRES